jgi:hypothetical protein
MSEQLSWPRLKALLRNESLGEYRTWLIASAVTAGALLIGAVVTVNNGSSDGPYYRFAFFAVLGVWGTIHTSLVFSALHDKSKNTAFLLLPASALEKTLAPLLTTTVILVAYLLAFTTIASVAIEAINWLVYRRTNDLFHPFEPETWAGVTRYLVVQSWFFLGAAWFRRAHFLKTLLTIWIGSLCLLGLTVAAALIAGIATFTPDGFLVQASLREWLFVPNPFTSAIRFSLAVLWLVALPVFCWVVAWLRVSETQVSHGV